MAASQVDDGKSLQRKKNRYQKHTTEEQRYTVCRRAGGQFSNLRPVFSKDEKYVFLCTGTQARVYSAITGELVRSLGDRKKHKFTIVAMFLHPTNDYRLVTISHDGFIMVWDWTDGSNLQHALISPATEVVSAMLVGTNLIWSDGKHISMISDFPQLKKVVLVSRLSVCSGVASSQSHLFAFGDRTVMLFRLKDGNMTTTDHEYLTLPTSYTSLCVGDNSFAYADVSGAIYLYNLEAFGKNKDLHPRKLHWHSSSVSALSFALNGGYLLSGGEENVLVLWQLRTSNKQFLPRLPGQIESISVSASSKHYGVKLSNNSIKIISSADLALRADIKGPTYTTGQLCSTTTQDDLIMANGSELQVWNLSTDRTALHVPVAAQNYAGKIQDQLRSHEATVTDCAANAEWMATLDSWTSPKEESVDLGYTKPQDESYLKFWQWTGQDYNLITRVDSPHGDSRVTQVLATGDGMFLTCGEDAAVRVWRQKAVKKDLIGGGVKVTGATWSCRRIIRFGRQGGQCRMALSKDNSILAIYSQTQEMTYLVDPSTGICRSTISCLSTGRLVTLGFVNQFLVLLGFKRLVVWDLLKGTVVYALKLSETTTELHMVCGTKTFAMSTNEQTRHAKSNAKIFIFDPESAKPIFREKCSKTLTLEYSPQYGFIQVTSDLEIVYISDDANNSLSDQTDNIAALQPVIKSGLSESYRPISNRANQSLRALDIEMQDMTISTARIAEVFVDTAKALPDYFEELALLVLGPPKDAFTS